jgi:2,4-dienoyl-CoA reductase (NADPH2)
MFENLFSPISINRVTIRNRIAYPSLGLLYSYDGKLNDRYYNFYQERAKGGCGIVTIGPVGFNSVGSGMVTLQLNDDSAIPSFKKAVGLIQKEGAAAWIQIFHAGAYSYSKLITGEIPVAPSPVYSNYSKLVPREMTIEEIKETQQQFVDTAIRAREAGFDGVELIGSAGYLITQFLSPLKNQRTDEYGGSFENRTRFPREIIEMMRRALGPDYPITIRMAGNDFVPGSNTDLETPDIARVYEKAGIDAINVTGGWHESRVPQLHMELPRGGFTYLAANIKKAVSVPVIASNRIPDPFTAEQILIDGMADMLNLGRVLIADPYWPEKTRQGRIDEIRPCVSCGQGCTDELFSGKPVFCLCNARAGFEGERGIEAASSPKKVMVIGAGPAGMEAAVAAASAGHTVTLYDRADEIGGQLWIAGTPPHKQELWELIRYYDAMLEKHGVEVVLEQEVTMDFIARENPDHVIVAEGSQPMVPPIQGIDDPTVVSAWDVLAHDPKLGTKVAVIGGGAVGLETAEFIADKGTLSCEAVSFLLKYRAESPERIMELMKKGTKEVTVFEMLPKAGAGVGKSNKWVLMSNIEMHNVDVITGAKVLSIDAGLISYEKDGAVSRAQFDTVVNAAGSRSVRAIGDAIAETGIAYTIIGDGEKPRQINNAIHEVFLAAMNLDRKSCPQIKHVPAIAVSVLLGLATIAAAAPEVRVEPGLSLEWHSGFTPLPDRGEGDLCRRIPGQLSDAPERADLSPQCIHDDPQPGHNGRQALLSWKHPSHTTIWAALMPATPWPVQ